MRKKKIMMSLLMGGVILAFAYGSIKVAQKGYRFVRDTRTSIAALYEAYNIGETPRMDSAVHYVLCLGNSITHSVPKSRVPGADLFWKGDWGMCASRPDSDYVHRLTRMLRQYNPSTIVEERNISVFERDFGIDLDSLIGPLCTSKDLIILRIGENVRDEEGYYKGFNRLVKYCKRYTDNIIVAGNTWKAPKKEEAMIRVAREQNLPYVPLFWILELYKDEVMPHVGDTIYDIANKPYRIETDFITTHPNDLGMKMIADEIYKKIRF